jgi:hypothetical protein
VVEARVDEGLVAATQAFVVDLGGSAHDLGDVIAGEFDVQSTGDRARVSVGVEESFDLGHHIFEAAGLVPGVRGDRIAVHRVADPGHMRQTVADAFEQSRQRLTDLTGTHAGDEGQAAGLGVRVELLGQGQGVICRGSGAELDADGVAHLGQEVDMCTIDLAGAFADPQEVAGHVVGFTGA